MGPVYFYDVVAYGHMQMEQTETNGGADYTSLRVMRDTHSDFVDKFEMDTSKSHDELLQKMIENYTADAE